MLTFHTSSAHHSTTHRILTSSETHYVVTSYTHYSYRILRLRQSIIVLASRKQHQRMYGMKPLGATVLPVATYQGMDGQASGQHTRTVKARELYLQYRARLSIPLMRLLLWTTCRVSEQESSIASGLHCSIRFFN
jgi:hypothetical protein